MSVKRKFKREKLRRMNNEEILSHCMSLFRRFGFEATNSDELPDLVLHALENLKSEEEIHGTLEGESEPQLLEQNDIEAEQEESQGLEFEEEAVEEEEEPTPSLAEIGDFEIAPDPMAILSPRVSSRPAAAKAAPAAPKPQRQIEEKPVTPEMVAAYEAKQAQMLNRVAAEGVHYKNNAGPSEGKKLVPHASVATRVSKLNAQRQPIKRGPVAKLPPPPQEGGEEEIESSPGDQKVNPATGLSLQEQRAIIARATGKTPAPPKGGMMNTLK